jgi:hypothetical protein
VSAGTARSLPPASELLCNSSLHVVIEVRKCGHWYRQHSDRGVYFYGYPYPNLPDGAGDAVLATADFVLGGMVREDIR